MRRFCRFWSLLGVFIAVCASSGCESLDVLHPQNTWRLNRGPALDERDAYFSVSDPAASAR